MRMDKIHGDGLSAAEISGMLSERIETLCAELFPNGRRIGHEYRTGNIHDEPGQSLGIHLEGAKAGLWSDFADPSQGGDALDLVKARYNLETPDAINWARGHLGLANGNIVSLAAQNAPPIRLEPEIIYEAPIPPTAGKAPNPPGLGEHSTQWAYRNADGEIVALVRRYEQPDGGKEFRPLTYWRRNDELGLGEWKFKSPPGPRPLYGLERLAKMPGALVHVCEGEKAADAAQRLFHVEPCVTWMGGSQAAGKADWTPLAARQALVWPDNDGSGRKAAKAVAEACIEAGAREVRIVDIPTDWPEKWDLADPLPDGVSRDDLDRLRRDAMPVTADQKSDTEKQKGSDRPRLISVDIASFLQTKIPPREMLLSPIIPTQGSAMLFAYRGIGKTYTALNAAYAVATGGNFLRWDAPKPRRVLYVDGEMPGADMQKRIAEVVKGAGLEPPSPDYFKIITPDIQEHGIPDLSTEEGQQCMEDHLDDVALVVVDNLSTLCRSGRENEAESWESMQQWLLDLRRRGMSVLLVHHAGKGGSQRGTSKREDILDTIISLKRPEDYRAEQGARFEIHYEKARGITGDDARAFEAAMETRDGAATWSMRNIEDAELDRVRDLTEQGYSVREIEKETEIPRSRVNRLQKQIKDEATATTMQYQD